MQGFFNLTKPVSNIRPATCGLSCTLNKGCQSPKMPVTGKGRMKILVIAEAPGEQEDEQNIQLIGPAGQLLRKTLAKYDVDLDRDCRKTNAVRCRPPENRKPTRDEIAACQPHIWDEIKTNPPKMILTLGQVALESLLLNHVKKIGQIGRWRGMTIPDQKAGCWICPTFHPSYILRSQRGRAIRGKSLPALSAEELVFGLDIKAALEKVEEPFPVMLVPEILSPSQIDFPDMARAGQVIAIDYETTGLRPYRSGHQIVSTGVCWGDKAVAFPMFPKLARQWKKVLADPGIKKVFHNAKFELQWAQHCLGTETKGVIWDSMIAAHIIDNRRNICGLKHQAYLALGMSDWSGDVKFDSDINGFNSLKDSGATEELLKYNAMDAWVTFQLYLRQRKLFR